MTATRLNDFTKRTSRKGDEEEGQGQLLRENVIGAGKDEEVKEIKERVSIDGM